MRSVRNSLLWNLHDRLYIRDRHFEPLTDTEYQLKPGDILLYSIFHWGYTENFSEACKIVATIAERLYVALYVYKANDISIGRNYDEFYGCTHEFFEAGDAETIELINHDYFVRRVPEFHYFDDWDGKSLYRSIKELFEGEKSYLRLLKRGVA